MVNYVDSDIIIGRGINICLVPSKSSRHFAYLFLFLWQSRKLDSLYIFSFYDLEPISGHVFIQGDPAMKWYLGFESRSFYAKPEISRNGKYLNGFNSFNYLRMTLKVHVKIFAVLPKWIPLIGNETLRYIHDPS